MNKKNLETNNFKSSDGGKWEPNSNHKLVPKKGIYKGSIDKWQKKLSNEIINHIEFIAGNELSLLGYKLINKDLNNFNANAYIFHKEDYLKSTGWRTSNRPAFIDYSFESFRRELLKNKVKEKELIELYFLFPEVYNELLEISKLDY